LSSVAEEMKVYTHVAEVFEALVRLNQAHVSKWSIFLEFSLPMNDVSSAVERMSLLMSIRDRLKEVTNEYVNVLTLSMDRAFNVVYEYVFQPQPYLISKTSTSSPQSYQTVIFLLRFGEKLGHYPSILLYRSLLLEDWRGRRAWPEKVLYLSNIIEANSKNNADEFVLALMHYHGWIRETDHSLSVSYFQILRQKLVVRLQENCFDWDTLSMLTKIGCLSLMFCKTEEAKKEHHCLISLCTDLLKNNGTFFVLKLIATDCLRLVQVRSNYTILCTTSSIVAALSSSAAVEPVNNCNIDNNDLLTFFISFASVARRRAT